MGGSNAVSAFGVALIAVFLVGYFGEKLLPPPKPTFIGIDLGTTFSCVGAYQPGTGNVTVFDTDQGGKCIPSVVTFLDNGTVLVGHAATRVAEKLPLQTIYDAKRFIGKQFTYQQFQSMQQRYSFKLLYNPHTQAITFQVQYSNGSTIDVGPEHVGACILTYLRVTASRALGREVTRCVVSVPAEFDMAQRNQTKAAAKMAGLDVWRVISEPTAAAMAYGLHELDGIQMVMVVDLGGGTLDVSLLNRQGGMFLTAAIAGNSYLGGQDFNQRLLEYVLAQSSMTRDNTSQQVLQELRTLVESAKITLTNQESALISHEEPPISIEITRDKFNAINDDLFHKIVTPIDLVLHEAGIPRDEVDEIVLVGGSTRVPRVRQMIGEYFGRTLNMEVDPDLAVVTGVSVQAGILGGMWPLQVSAVEIPMSARKIHVT
jgi:stress 70 chaperone-associated protein